MYCLGGLVTSLFQFFSMESQILADMLEKVRPSRFPHDAIGSWKRLRDWISERYSDFVSAGSYVLSLARIWVVP